MSWGPPLLLLLGGLWLQPARAAAGKVLSRLPLHASLLLPSQRSCSSRTASVEQLFTQGALRRQCEEIEKDEGKGAHPQRPLLLPLLQRLRLKETEVQEKQSLTQGSHSLRYLESSLSGPLPGVPWYSYVGYVDDIPISGYTSESRREEPRAPWMERITAEDPQYWERNTELSRGWEQVSKADVRTVMERVNQTRGLHIIQYMYGCELRGNGSIGGFRQHAFDGHDLLSFDKDRLTYTAALDAAIITQDRWNSDRIFIQRGKEYMEGECIEFLKKYLKLGAERLQTVAPQTLVRQRKNGDRTFLTGYAYGFYPRDIEVKWVRNGVEIPLESMDILPNPDGTYQVRTTVEVHEGDDEKTYRYEVYHSSLPDTVTVMYEKKSPPMGLIIRGAIGALVGVGLLAVVVWVVYLMKKTSGKSTYTAAKKDRRPGVGGSHQHLQQRQIIL